MKNRKSTMVELVTELEALKASASTQEMISSLQFMIDEARAGEYHDYKNQRYICGKAESSAKLRQLGYIDLAKRIEHGEFDEEADQEDKLMMREGLPEQAWPLFKL